MKYNQENNDRTQITNEQYDNERALYNLQHADIINCNFAGPADGESVLKEARDISIKKSRFSLRYPVWHVKDFTISDSIMDKSTHAAIWYAENGSITDSTLNGIKAVRECNNICLKHCKVNSEEFGWKSDHIVLQDTDITGEYLFFDSRNVKMNHVHMKGKYSFQYMENMEISDCELDTKDAFWQSKNVTVQNSIVKGEYLGWFSDNLTLINCKIIGTQPLCYCNNLHLINCTMEDADLSFEYSEVEADIKGHIQSIKNPKAGTIIVDTVEEIIRETPIMECTGNVLIREKSARQGA